ncbi:hypothetical protein JCM6882_005572 [Rhodosporidiobolus microsporus]
MGQPTPFSSLAVLQQAQQGQQPAQPAPLPSTSASSAGNTSDHQQGDGTQPPEKKKRRRTAEDGKRYACDHEGCGKAFSRPDHLSRHKLNHNPTTVYECNKCPKTFVRMDLLVRHQERHDRKERGDEPLESARKQEAARKKAVAAAQAANPPAAGANGKKYEIPDMPAGPPSSAAVYAADQSVALQQSIFNTLPGATPNIPPMPAFPMLPNGDLSVNTPSSGTYSTLSPHAMSNHSASPAENAFSGPPPASSAPHQPQGPSPPAGSSVFASALVIPTDFAAPPPSASPHAPVQQPLHPPPPPPPAHQPSPSGLNLVNQALAAGHALSAGGAGAVSAPPAPPTEHSPFAFDPHQTLTGVANGSSHHDFEEPFNFLSTNYGAPFASASDYSWLFAPDQSYDVHFAASRPASPGAGNHDFLAGFGLTGMQTPGGRFNFGSGGAGGGGPGGMGALSSQLEKVSKQLEATEQQQQQQQAMELLGITAPPPHQQQQQQHPQQHPHHPHAHHLPHHLQHQHHHPHGPPSPIKLETLVEESPSQLLVQTPGSISHPTPGGSQPPLSQPTPQPHVQPPPQPAPVPESNGLFNTGVRAAATDLPPLDPSDPTTFVDEATRGRVLEYLGPEWSYLHSDPRLGAQPMAYYLSLFWVKVHETQAPAVHRASFRPSSTPTPLLLSMMLLGSYFAPPESYQLALQLHPWFRGKVFCSPDFRPRAEIWLMQTVLLILVFGKLCSTRMDHEMSHIFQSSFVQLGRRSGLFSQRIVEVPEEKRNDPEALWKAWIEEEVAKRLAQIMFAVDVEHAAFFRHAHTLSAFQVQLPLPCDEDQWEAPDALSWKRLHDQQRPPIQFISALKASLTAVHDPPQLNPFGRISVLHGLLSVAQDLQWRDHVLGFSTPERRSHNWRDMISSAYNLWKQRLDEALVSASPATTQLLRASISLYATAQITFSIDIHELQIYAGAETAAGLIISPPVFHATESRIRVWSGSREGRASTWHAVHFLRSCLQHWRQSTADLAGCLHHRWTVYIAFLTVYAFGRSTSGPPAPPVANYQEASMNYLDAMCTGTPDGLLAVSGKQNCLELAITVQEYIRDTRWELVQDAARILERLVTKPPATPHF